MQRKKSLRALDSFANWTRKGGGIQGISAASAARAETLSDALGTRFADSKVFDFRTPSSVF